MTCFLSKIDVRYFYSKVRKPQKTHQQFLRARRLLGEVNYLAFPQSGTTLAFYSNSLIALEPNCITLSKTNKRIPKTLLLGKYKLPIQIHYKNYSPEISINFTPTGLNYFFQEDASETAHGITQLIYNEKWVNAGNQIFKESSTEERISFLESFLLETLLKKDLSQIEKCLDLLKTNPTETISALAEKMNVSPKTIHRWFTKYVGCSPKDFKKIARFRKVIDSKFDNSLQNLTQTSLESDFYDSPHFSREFKNLTQMNPRDFFADIDYVMKKNIPYKFM